VQVQVQLGWDELAADKFDYSGDLVVSLGDATQSVTTGSIIKGVHTTTTSSIKSGSCEEVQLWYLARVKRRRTLTGLQRRLTLAR